MRSHFAAWQSSVCHSMMCEYRLPWIHNQDRDLLTLWPILKPVLVWLAVFQMFAAGLASTDGNIQIAVEVVLFLGLGLVVLVSPMRGWELGLLLCLVVVTLGSFSGEGLGVFAVNAKQNTLGVLSVIVFPRMKFQMRGAW